MPRRTTDPCIPGEFKIGSEKLYASMPISLLARLDDYVQQAGVTKSSVLRAALISYLEAKGGTS